MTRIKENKDFLYIKGQEKVQVQIAEKPFEDDHPEMWPYFAMVTLPDDAPKWVENQATVKSLLWPLYRFKLSYFCKQKLISGYQHELGDSYSVEWIKFHILYNAHIVDL